MAAAGIHAAGRQDMQAEKIACIFDIRRNPEKNK